MNPAATWLILCAEFHENSAKMLWAQGSGEMAVCCERIALMCWRFAGGEPRAAAPVREPETVTATR